MKIFSLAAALSFIVLSGFSTINRWELTDGPESKAAPAIAGYSKDGSIYVAATNLDGDVVYSATAAPKIWTSWQPIGTPPPSGFALDSSPVLVNAIKSKELRVYARGADNNLYRAVKIDGSSWNNWAQVISDGNVSGRFTIALTWQNPELIPEEHIVYVSNNGCQYHRVTAGSGHIKTAWPGCHEAVISGDTTDEVGVVLRFVNAIEFKVVRRTDEVVVPFLKGNPNSFDKLQKLSPWTINPLRSLSRRAFSLSSLVRFEDDYHVVFTNRQITDDVGPDYIYSLKHAWFDSRSGDAQLRDVAKYLPTQDKHALPDLALYRNKLLLTWKSVNGRILSARWDNADPALPWITYGRAGSGVGQHRPVIVSFNRRPFVPSLEMGAPQYGDDAFAVISGTRQNGKPEFIVISRALMRRDLAREVSLYNSRSDTLDPVCRNPSDPFGPEKIASLWSDDRMVLSEIGFNLWVFPNWMIHDLYSDFTKWMCTSADGQWKDGQTPCQTSRLPVYIKVTGGMFNCGGAWINRDTSYIGVWEEMGHYLTPALGFGTSMMPTQASAENTGIPLPTLNTGRQLFTEATGSCAGTPSPRCTGFTGIAGNYDNGGVEHSFMYAIYYYLTRGDELRQFIATDLAMGSNLLQRKYNWIKENIFRGIEYRNNLEPI